MSFTHNYEFYHFRIIYTFNFGWEFLFRGENWAVLGARCLQNVTFVYYDPKRHFLAAEHVV